MCEGKLDGYYLFKIYVSCFYDNLIFDLDATRYNINEYQVNKSNFQGNSRVPIS